MASEPFRATQRQAGGAGPRGWAAPVELAWTEVGGDGPGSRPLLAVHGFTGAKEDFAAQAQRFAARGFRVVMPDLRGHGSSPSSDSYDLTAMAADLAALVDRLGWDRFAVLGHSMGGMVSQRLALDHADRVSALVLVGTTDGPVPIDPGLVELARAVVADGGMPALLAAQKALGSTLITSTASAARLRELHVDWDEYRDRSFLACSPAMYRAVARALLHEPSRLGALASLPVPTLVVVGDEDEVMLPGSRRLAAAIPGAELLVVHGAGHHPQAERPLEFAETVGAFLDRVVPAAG